MCRHRCFRLDQLQEAGRTHIFSILRHNTFRVRGVAIGPVSEGVGFRSASKGSKSLNSTMTWESQSAGIVGICLINCLILFECWCVWRGLFFWCMSMVHTVFSCVSLCWTSRHVAGDHKVIPGDVKSRQVSPSPPATKKAFLCKRLPSRSGMFFPKQCLI